MQTNVLVCVDFFYTAAEQPRKTFFFDNISTGRARPVIGVAKEKVCLCNFSLFFYGKRSAGARGWAFVE